MRTSAGDEEDNSMGANVIISNHIGQNDKRSIREAIGTVGITALVSGLFLMVLGISVARPILTLMNTPADVLDLAVTYLRIFFLGIPFFMIFDFGSAILRSMGDTRRPLYILVVAGIVNTILNLIHSPYPYHHFRNLRTSHDLGICHITPFQ